MGFTPPYSADVLQAILTAQADVDAVLAFEFPEWAARFIHCDSLPRLLTPLPPGPPKTKRLR